MGNEVHTGMQEVQGCNKMQRRSSCRGFSLIEVGLVMVVIASLAGVVLTSSRFFQRRGYDSVAAVALRAVAVAEEAYYERYETYKECDQTDCHLVLEDLAPAPHNVSLQMALADASGASIQGSAKHNLGTGRAFEWANRDSSTSIGD